MVSLAAAGAASDSGQVSGRTSERSNLASLLDGLRRRISQIPDSDDRALLRAAAEALEGEAAAREAAERRVVEREQQMDLIEQLTATGSWEYDMTSDRIVWSREQLRIHGLPLDQPERTEADFLQLVHPDDRERIVDVMSHLVESGEPFYVEYRIVRADGEERLLQAPGRLVPGPDGRLTRMIGTSLDITERRKTELALRASEESYRTIFQHASDAMWLHDVETGAFIEVNDAACEVFG